MKALITVEYVYIANACMLRPCLGDFSTGLCGAQYSRAISTKRASEESFPSPLLSSIHPFCSNRNNN